MTKTSNYQKTALLLTLLTQITLQSPQRVLAMFVTTPDGHRFPKWLQIVTFILLLLTILISLVLIILWSKSAAGPPRLNEMVVESLRMQGKLPKLGMGMGGYSGAYGSGVKGYASNPGFGMIR